MGIALSSKKLAQCLTQIGAKIEKAHASLFDAGELQGKNYVTIEKYNC